MMTVVRDPSSLAIVNNIFCIASYRSALYDGNRSNIQTRIFMKD